MYLFASQVSQNLPVSAGDMDLITGSGRSSGGGNCNPHQYSCLGSPTDDPGRVGWQNWTWPNDWAHTHTCADTHTHKFIFFKDKMKKLWLGLVNILPQTQQAPESEALPRLTLPSFFFDEYFFPVFSHGRKE